MTDTIYSQLRQNLVTATKTIFPSNKVILSNLNGQEPNNPYVAIRIIRDTQTGIASHDTRLSATGKQTTTTNHEVLVQFSFVAVEDFDAAGDLATHFLQKLETSATREAFRLNHLAKLSATPLRNMTYKRETLWAQQYNVDILFMYAVRTEQAMTPIDTVVMEDLLTGDVYTIPPNVVIS